MTDNERKMKILNMGDSSIAFCLCVADLNDFKTTKRRILIVEALQNF